MTKHTQKLLIHFHTDEKKHMNKLHDNIISSLLYLDNKTTEHFMVSEANNHLLVPLKKELKEDFNNYANKVADMTSDLGTSTLKLRESFRGLESQVNGLDKNLKTLIGRVGIDGSPNGSIVCEDDKIQEVLRSKFQKVLANQEEFMKGCYKVQMQEPQIEGEISAMLEKLLDMVVKRFGENDRDARVFKHMIKNHHEQTQRNLVQLNENIASVYGRSTASIHEIEQVIRDVQENVRALYTYLKGVLPEGREQHLKVILDKLQKIEEYTKRFKGCPDHVKPELKKIQNTLTSMMKVIAVEKPKSRDADIVKAVQAVFGTGNSSSNTSTTTLPWDPTKINIRGDLASNGHDAKNDTRNPSNSDNDTTEGGTSGPFPDSTTVPYTDNQSTTTVVQTLISVQNSTNSSDLAPKMAVGPVRNLLTENSASQNGTTVSPADNKGEATVVSLQNSTKPPNDSSVVLLQHALKGNTSQNGTTVPSAVNGNGSTVVENAVQSASTENTETSQSDNRVPPIDNNSKATVVEKIGALLNETQPLDAAPENTVAPLQSGLTGSTEASQSDTTVPPIDNNSKATVVEKVGALQNGTQPLDAAPENTVTPLQSGLTGSTEASQSDTTVPPIDNNSKATVVEKVGALQNGTQPLDAAPENTVAPLQSGLTGSTGTSQSDTTVPPIDNNSKATEVEKVGALQNGTKPLDAAPKNTVAPLQSGLTENTETSQSDTTVPPIDNNSKTTEVEKVGALQNGTQPLNAAPKTTAVPLQSGLTENTETSQSDTTVPPIDNNSKTTEVEKVGALQNGTQPLNAAPETTVVPLQSGLTENTETSQSDTTVPPIDNNSKTTEVEKVGALQNGTQPLNAAPETTVVPLQSGLTENTETSQSDTTVPPIDNNSKTTEVEKVGALQNGTQPLNAAPETTVVPLQSGLTENTETSQSDTTVPPIDNNSKTTEVEKVGALQNGTQPLNAAPETTVVPLQSGLTENTETSQSDTTVPPIDNNSKTTEVEKVGALQNGTKPFNAAPENSVAPLQSGLTGNTETSQSDTTVPPIDNSKATVVEKVGALQNGTKPSNAGPENTVAPLQSRLTGTTETLQSETTVPPVDNNSKTRSLQNTTNPFNDVPEATVALSQNVSTVSSNVETRKIPEATTALASGITAPSNDKLGTTTKIPENNSAVLPKSEPANDEPEKNEIASKNISIASTTPLPKRSHIRPSDSNSEFAYRKLPEPDYEDVEIAV
ncbi:unnamed protein product [Callosobruchus maculatus]|uniref:Uncharacterized protein n=1 Tax=Callosobruchus maculatus TaxID=64391 RepID=A0A653DMM9_CALMS|nr:unnamed protein product [Callosobruchus maculatus]